jgi:lambda family phage portal protein
MFLIDKIKSIFTKTLQPESADPFSEKIVSYISSVFDGDPYPGAYGDTKYGIENYIDYYELRERSKQLFTENPYCKGLIKRLIRNEINNGLTLEAAPISSIIGLTEDQAQTWADEQETNWRLWSDIDYICDYKEQDSLGEIASRCRMSSLISGDCLVVLRINQKTNLPCVELIDGGYVQSPLLNDYTGKNEIKHGVEIDSKGRHVAYYVATSELGEYKRIPAWGEKSGRRLAWLVYGSDLRVDEVRGEPLLACMLYMMRDLDRYRNAETRAAVVNAMLPMFIRKTESGPSSRMIDAGATKRGYQDVVQEDGTTKKWNWGKMMPGTVFQSLAKGEEPVSFNTQRPNVNYRIFEEAILDVFAWVNELPPEILRLNFKNNFSASRQANNEYNIYLSYRCWKFGKDFYQPIYIEHTIQSVLLGQIKAPGLIEAWMKESGWRIFGAWCNSEWTGISRPSVDIKKDVSAATEMLDYGLTTQDQQCRKLSGMSFKTVIAKRKREIDLMNKMGLSFKSEENNNGEPITKQNRTVLKALLNLNDSIDELNDRTVQ